MLHTAWSAITRKLPHDALNARKHCCCGRGRGQQRLHRGAATRAILTTAAYRPPLPAEARGTRAEECGRCPGVRDTEFSMTHTCRRRSDTSHVTNLHTSPPLTILNHRSLKSPLAPANHPCTYDTRDTAITHVLEVYTIKRCFQPPHPQLQLPRRRFRPFPLQ